LGFRIRVGVRVRVTLTWTRKEEIVVINLRRWILPMRARVSVGVRV